MVVAWWYPNEAFDVRYPRIVTLRMSPTLDLSVASALLFSAFSALLFSAKSTLSSLICILAFLLHIQLNFPSPDFLYLSEGTYSSFRLSDSAIEMRRAMFVGHHNISFARSVRQTFPTEWLETAEWAP